MVGFTGLKVQKETAGELEKIATKFCEESDETLPQNQGKKIYLVYLPLARWVRLAGQIVVKQTTLTSIASELEKTATRTAIVTSELSELAVICKDSEKEIAAINEGLEKTPKLIENVR